MAFTHTDTHTFTIKLTFTEFIVFYRRRKEQNKRRERITYFIQNHFEKKMRKDEVKEERVPRAGIFIFEAVEARARTAGYIK